jgi:hypothetical protein
LNFRRYSKTTSLTADPTRLMIKGIFVNWVTEISEADKWTLFSERIRITSSVQMILIFSFGCNNPNPYGVMLSCLLSGPE